MKVIRALHKPPWNGMRVFNRDQTKGHSKPSSSYCNLSAGWHGDASAFNLLEGVVLIILPTNRERQSNINTRPDRGPPESCLHRNIKGGTWQLAQGLCEEAELHYLQICVIKLTSEAQNNRGGEETGPVWQLARDKQSTGTGSHLNESVTTPPSPWPKSSHKPMLCASSGLIQLLQHKLAHRVS